MRIIISAHDAEDIDLYSLRRYARNDLTTCFVDTASGYGNSATAGRWAEIVLEAMGKSPTASGWAGRASDNLTVLPIWLVAHQTKWVIVPDAHLIPAVARGKLVETLAAGGVNLLLPTRPYRLQETLSAYRGLIPDLVGWDHLEAMLPPRDPEPSNKPFPRDSTEQQTYVPDSDWFTFLHDARQLLDPASLPLVEHAYHAAYEATAQAFTNHKAAGRVTVELMRAHLARATRNYASDGLVTAAIRGTQAACFSLRLNLRIARTQLLQILADTHQAQPRDQDWMALRIYRDTHRALACSLHLAGLSIRHMREMTLRDAANLQHTGSHLGYHLDARAQPFLNAQLLWRRHHGAELTDVLLPLTDNYLSQLINATAREIGLRIGVERVKPRGRHSLGYWQYRDGFLLHAITTA